MSFSVLRLRKNVLSSCLDVLCLTFCNYPNTLSTSHQYKQDIKGITFIKFITFSLDFNRMMPGDSVAAQHA